MGVCLSVDLPSSPSSSCRFGVGFLPKKASRAEEEEDDVMVEEARKAALVADFCASA